MDRALPRSAVSTQPLPTAAPQRRRWWLRPAVWALALLAVLFGWGGWRVYDDHAAEGEARAAGFGWETGESPLAVIRADWHAAFHRVTWRDHRRYLTLPAGSDLAALRPLLLRLRPMSDLTLVIHRADGTATHQTVRCRIDTAIEVDYVRHGGILPYVLRQLLSA